LELVVEDAGVVDDGAVEEPIELFGVDAVGSLDLAVEAWGGRADIGVADALVDDVPVEGGLELGTEFECRSGSSLPGTATGPGP
jgi:hypothetical protein